MRTHRFLLAATLVVGTAHAGPAEDQRRAEAKALFDEGVKAATAGDSKAALAAFRAAYDKFPSAKVLYNIAQSCKGVGDNACAVRSYEQYLRESENLPSKRVKEVEGELKTLGRSIGRITIKSNIPAADILVDDAPVGRTPAVEGYAVNPGTHKVAVPYHGKPIEQSVKVSAGETTTAQIDAPEETSSNALIAALKEPEPEKPEKKDEALAPSTPSSEEPKSFPVIPWTITGVLAAGTVVTGILATSALSDYRDKKEQFPISRDELDSSQGTARDLFLVTGLLGAGTVIAGSIALYSTFSSGAATTPNKRVGVAVGPSGVTVRGVFP